MTILDMGHGVPHAYVVNDGSTVTEAHGVQHRYITAGQREATLDPRLAPWGAAIHRAQSLMRGQFPELGRPLPAEQSPRSHALRQILRANGYHGAENAFVMTHPHPERRRSSVVSAPDQFGDYHPGVALHPEQNDYGTLAHEAGHLLHHQAAGIDAMDLSDHDDELKHGPDFAHHYQRALQVVHPPAAGFFGTVLPRIKRTIDMANGQHQAGWATPEQFARERPHGAAVNQAQQAVRRAVPTMDMDLGKPEDATGAVQHMMRRGGHPDADEAFVMKHSNPDWGQSQAFFSDGQPGIALHPDRWDYGTAAHEVAHHLHEHELGHHPSSDEEAHGPGFIRHYQNVLGDFGSDASRVLGETYHQSLNKLKVTGSAETPFIFSHEETQTGGTKHPVQVDLHAHHPDSNEPVGTLRYYPPKRRGGPVDVDNITTHHPGAGSALLNEMESRHPGSRTNFLYEVKRNNNNPDVTGHGEKGAGDPSDWDTHHSNLTPQVHRGLGLTLPSQSARVVNSSAPKEEHLAELHAGLSGAATGTHWTENEQSAQHFAHNAVSDYRTTIPVVIHAQTPPLKDIETRREHLYRGGVFPYGNSHLKENEVPVRKGRNVTVTGISWRPDAPHPDADENGWMHHTYDEPMQRKATQFTAATMYHWAPKDARDDIAEHGLDHTRAPGFDPNSHGPHGTFMHHNRALADDWAEGISHTHDLYAVNTKGLGLHPDPYDTGDASYSERAVPPERLQRLGASMKGFDKLAPHEQAAAAMYQKQMIEDGDAESHTTPHDYNYEMRQEPLKKFIKRYMDADDEFKAAYGPDDFQAHHEEMLRNHPIPHYPATDRWPLIVSDSNPNYVDDGYHRMHSYIRDGATSLPTMRMWPKEGVVKTTAKAFTPTQRLFGPTEGLDHRLFDGEHLKGDVREYIISTLSQFWEPLFGECGWEEWAIVYFAGSEASEWTSSTLEGNNDFDVLIGVNYQEFRACQSRTSKYQTMTDEEITADINKGLRILDEQTAAAMIPVGGIITGPWSNTWYVNQDSYDIRAIKPYAAYDVTHDRWAVKPPHLENWSLKDFPEGSALIKECRAVAAYVRAVLALPEPYRSQQGLALWQHLHSDRSRAFGPQGEGWYDPGNVIEKWLDQEGLWEKLVAVMVSSREHPETLSAPANWSNDPRSA